MAEERRRVGPFIGLIIFLLFVPVMIVWVFLDWIVFGPLFIAVVVGERFGFLEKGG